MSHSDLWDSHFPVAATYDRYARQIRDKFRRDIPSPSISDSDCENRWEQWKNALSQQQELKDYVRGECKSLVESLPQDERQVLLLGPETEGLTGNQSITAIVDALFEAVQDLALDQIRIAEQFGRGFFEDDDIVLPQIREALARLTKRRQSLEEDQQRLLQKLLSIVDSLPQEHPDETITLLLSYEADYGVSRGSRTYSLVVSPDTLELSLSGHEWTEGVGGDAWSGPLLSVAFDGKCRRDGDIEWVLNEIISAADDPNYEICLASDDLCELVCDIRDPAKELPPRPPSDSASE